MLNPHKAFTVILTLLAILTLIALSTLTYFDYLIFTHMHAQWNDLSFLILYWLLGWKFGVGPFIFQMQPAVTALGFLCFIIFIEVLNLRGQRKS